MEKGQPALVGDVFYPVVQRNCIAFCWFKNKEKTHRLGRHHPNLGVIAFVHYDAMLLF